MNELLVVFFVLECLTYSGLMFYFFLGAQRLYRKNTIKVTDKSPSISVIIPAKNEEETLLMTLEALNLQDYTGTWEVICINDNSTDKTPQILQSFCESNSRFRYFEVPANSPAIASPKKRALALGFSHAKGDILITTDADCTPPPVWLSSMAKNFGDSIGIVQGPKKISGPSDLITRYQKLEMFGFVSIEAATFAMGTPMIASAPSLAYRKDLYEKAGGFNGLEHLISGDDDMLVHKIRQLEGVHVRYNLDATATVVTRPTTTWAGLISQRARWASNGSKYQDKKFVVLLINIFIFYLWLLIGPIFLIKGLVPLFCILIPWALFYLLSFMFLLRTSHKFGEKKMLLDFWWASIFHVPIIIFSTLMGQLGLFNWKGEAKKKV